MDERGAAERVRAGSHRACTSEEPQGVYERGGAYAVRGRERSSRAWTSEQPQSVEDREAVERGGPRSRRPWHQAVDVRYEREADAEVDADDHVEQTRPGTQLRARSRRAWTTEKP